MQELTFGYIDEHLICINYVAFRASPTVCRSFYINYIKKNSIMMIQDVLFEYQLRQHSFSLFLIIKIKIYLNYNLREGQQRERRQAQKRSEMNLLLDKCETRNVQWFVKNKECDGCPGTLRNSRDTIGVLVPSPLNFNSGHHLVKVLDLLPPSVFFKIVVGQVL